MLGKSYRHVLVGVIGAVGAMFGDIDVEDVDAALTTNSWTSHVSGKWEIADNWAVGVPTANHTLDSFINVITKTVTIDAATALSNGLNSCMTISNLLVSNGGGGGGSTNTLQLTDAGIATPLRILNGFTILGNGVLLVTNSALRVDGLSGGSFSVDGSVSNLADGQIVVTNCAITIGNTNIGITASLANFTTSGGLLLASNVVVGDVVGSQGALTINGGTNLFTGTMSVGANAGATGAVWLTSGLLSNATARIAVSGVGQMAVSNGTWLSVGQVDVGLFAGSRGTLTIAGGTNRMTSALNIGSQLNATGTVWLTDSTAQLVVTNSSFTIGSSGTGQLTISNGSVLAQNTFVGNDASSQGTLTLAGGTYRSSTMAIGSQLNATGTVWLTGSAALLVATNFTTDIGNNGAGQMIVSNGTWLAIAARVGNLAGSQGTLTIAGGTNSLSFGLTIGSSANATGTVVLGGGSLWITNAAGNAVLDVRSGSLLLNSGNLTVDKLIATNGANSVFTFNGGALSSQSSYFTNGAVPVLIGAVSNSATFSFQGTTHSLANGLTLGNTGGSTGTVWMTGTQLVVTNGDTRLGVSGVGQMTLSNGTWLARRVDVGSAGGSQGTLTIAGGDCFIAGSLFLAFSASATGTVWVTGGQLTNDSIRIGQLNFGQMTVSNGLVSAKTVLVGGDNFGSRGVWTIVGGTNRVDTSLTLGNGSCTSTGTVLLAGGLLLVTNSTGNAMLEVRSGTVTLTSGTLLVDNLVVSNACGRFLHYGGTLSVGNTNNVSPSLDADGDGLPNGWEATFALDAFNDTGDTGSAGDPDGDGFSNLQEYQAGTNPNDPNSTPLRITAIARESSDIRVTWSTFDGTTNALQATAGGAGGSYSNNFTDIFTVTNTVGVTTNYLDVGGATNFPSRYYRVRLVP